MDINAAKNFDRSRDFLSYTEADLVGATRWLIGVMEASSASSKLMEPVQEFFRTPLSQEQEAEVKEKLSTYLTMLIDAGTILTKPLGQFSETDLVKLDWVLPQNLPVPLVQGQVRVEPATEAYRNIVRNTSTSPGGKPLEKMITIQAAGRKWPLLCADDALESLGADLSVFEGTYNVAVRAWPDQEGRLFVLEAAPLINLPDFNAGDFAQGRLFDNRDVTSPVVLRVDKQQQITLPVEIQEELRPFVGTAVILYGNRETDAQSGKVTLTDVHPDYWVLCRLTDPKDDANNLAQAPLPALQHQGCLCIGGTPPWNWEGPNVRTHMLCPTSTMGLIRTTERRFVFGRAIQTLPDWVQNPIPEIKRILQVTAVTERDTDSEAHWATRLGPVTPVRRDLGAIAYLTSATALVTP